MGALIAALLAAGTGERQLMAILPFDADASVSRSTDVGFRCAR